MRFSRLLQSVVSFREGACTDLPISLSRTWDKVTNLSLIFLAPVESWGGLEIRGVHRTPTLVLCVHRVNLGILDPHGFVGKISLVAPW
jgi:hypothetical protein